MSFLAKENDLRLHQPTVIFAQFLSDHISDYLGRPYLDEPTLQSVANLKCHENFKSCRCSIFGNQCVHTFMVYLAIGHRCSRTCHPSSPGSCNASCNCCSAGDHPGICGRPKISANQGAMSNGDIGIWVKWIIKNQGSIRSVTCDTKKHFWIWVRYRNTDVFLVGT